MSTTIHLVRHAMHDALDRVLVGRLPGTALSTAGRAQSARLAARLAELAIAQVQSSPQTRALQTARAIAWGTGARLSVVPALDEIDFGEWTGRTFDSLAADPAWERWNAVRSQARPPAGESMREAQERVWRHLCATERAYPESSLVMVTHAEIIRAVVLGCRGLPLDRWSEIDITPGSVTTLSIRSGRPQLAALESEVAS